MSARKLLRTAMVGSMAVLLFAGCTGEGDGDGDSSPSTSSSASRPDVPDGEATGGAYGVIEAGEIAPDKSLGEMKTGPRGEQFVLTNLWRIGSDRVVVEGLATLSTGAGAWGFFNEAGYSGVEYGFGGDFGGVTLTRKGDPATYQPVRNADRSCVCTSFPVNHDGGTPVPVFVVVSAPSANDGFTVTVAGLGSINDLTVSSG